MCRTDVWLRAGENEDDPTALSRWCLASAGLGTVSRGGWLRRCDQLGDSVSWQAPNDTTLVAGTPPPAVHTHRHWQPAD